MKISFEIVNIGREIPRINSKVPSVSAHHRHLGLSRNDGIAEKIFFIGLLLYDRIIFASIFSLYGVGVGESEEV